MQMEELRELMVEGLRSGEVQPLPLHHLRLQRCPSRLPLHGVRCSKDQTC